MRTPTVGEFSFATAATKQTMLRAAKQIEALAGKKWSRRSKSQPPHNPKKRKYLFCGKLNTIKPCYKYTFFLRSIMPKCPGCNYPRLSYGEILCAHCIYEDERVRWPQCQRCYQWNADCGESGYLLCYPCYNAHMRRLHFAAYPIQLMARGFLARRRLKKHKAAKSIQAVWRGYLTRTQLALQ